jgi:hypothetical protein
VGRIDPALGPSIAASLDHLPKIGFQAIDFDLAEQATRHRVALILKLLNRTGFHHDLLS